MDRLDRVRGQPITSNGGRGPGSGSQRPLHAPASLQRSHPAPLVIRNPDYYPQVAQPSTLTTQRPGYPQASRDPRVPYGSGRTSNNSAATPSPLSRQATRSVRDLRSAPFPTIPRDYSLGNPSQAPYADRLSRAPPSARSQARPTHARASSSVSSTTTISSSASFFELRRRGSRGSGSDTSEDSRVFQAKKRVERGRERDRSSSMTWRRGRSEGRNEFDADEALIPPVPPVPANVLTLQRQPTNHGQTIWARVVAAANATARAFEESFYERDIENYDDTPGGESRLTTVLKSYYLERARSKGDLPDWLFKDDELYSDGRVNGASYVDDRAGFKSAPPTRRDFRDIYDAAAVRSGPPPSNRLVGKGEATGAGRTTNRLRDLRDAKQLAHLALSEKPVVLNSPLTAGLAARPKPRLGLPAGPRPARI